MNEELDALVHGGGDDGMSEEPKTYRMENHTGWGDRIGWSDYPKRINGHLSQKPSKGDYITCEMKSGKIGVFRVASIEYCRDPQDMFFANVEPLGYEDELSIPAESLAKWKQLC